MIAGEFDLSVGSLAALTGVISLEIISIGVLPALLVGVLFAAAVGVIQGLLIGVLGINSLVFTIGTLIGLRRLAMVVAHEQTITMPIEQLPDVDVLTSAFPGRFLSYQRRHDRRVHRRRPVSQVHPLGPRDLRNRRGAQRGPGRWRACASADDNRVYLFGRVGWPGRGAVVDLSRQRDAARIRLASALRRDDLPDGRNCAGRRIGNVIGIAIGLFTLRFLVTGMAATRRAVLCPESWRSAPC